MLRKKKEKEEYKKVKSSEDDEEIYDDDEAFEDDDDEEEFEEEEERKPLENQIYTVRNFPTQQTPLVYNAKTKEYMTPEQVLAKILNLIDRK
jgi:hypothetical protein